MIKKWSVFLFLLFITLILTSCSPFLNRGLPEDTEITADDIPEEPEKDELISTIKGNTSNEIDDIIEANFALIDSVSGDGSHDAAIYATTVLQRSELKSVLTAALEPEKVSEVKDNQQILIYPDYFVTLKVSDDDSDVTLIEVAGDEFVRRNYSPSFLSTYFAIRLMDSFLGVNDWGRKRARECKSSNCYGGYTGKGYGTPSRGHTSFRGGGPGAGK